MPKVLVVSNDFAPSLGGIAQVMGYMCRSLPPETVTVLAQCMPGDKEYDAAAPFKVYRALYKSDRKLDSLISVARYAKAMRQIMAKEKFDAVFYDKAFPLGLISHQPMRPPLPYIVQAYGNDIVCPRTRIEERLQARVLRGAHRIISISNFTSEALIRLGVEPERIALMFPKMDFQRFDKKPDIEELRSKLGVQGNSVILSVGRLVPRKGFDMTIMALPRILKEIPNALYLIVGNGPDLGRLKQLAKEHGVADHVRIVNNCDNASLPDYYHACDVFCMPSRYIKAKGDVEGFGIVFLEANACRKAVLGGNSGGQPDAIEDGKTGLLCNPESPEDIANKLILLLRDPDRMTSMGEYGHERVKNHFQAHHYGLELKALLSTI